MNGIARLPAALLVLIISLSPIGRTAAQSIEAIAQSSNEFRLEQLASGLGVPWGMTFIGPGRLLFTERAGTLKLLDIETLRLQTIDGTPEVVAEGQGGLLDVAIGPGFAADGWIYFTYSKPVNSEAATTLARARLDGRRLVDWQDLLVTDSATGTRRHFGSRIAFDDQGHVYFGVGDRGERDRAQDTANHLSAILRLDLDGSVPADNPFVGDGAARDEIWTWGHRNPQGLFFDRASGKLWAIEHGPRGGDEINLILKGRNYGWPVVSHGKEYWGPVSIGEGISKPGLEDPRKVYIPSIAPGSLLVYRGNAFPAWRGNLFAGALKLRHLNRVTVSESGEALGEQRLLEDFNQRIRALAESPEGWIYLSTDDGRILRMRPPQ